MEENKDKVIIPKFVCGWSNFILAFKGWFVWCDSKSEANTWSNLQKIICHNNYYVDKHSSSSQVYNIIMNGVDDYNRWCLKNGFEHKIVMMRDLNDLTTEMVFNKFSHKLQIIINIGHFFANMDSDIFHFEKPVFTKNGDLEFGMKTRGMTYKEMNKIVEQHKW